MCQFIYHNVTKSKITVVFRIENCVITGVQAKYVIKYMGRYMGGFNSQNLGIRGLIGKQLPPILRFLERKKFILIVIYVMIILE